MVSVAQLCEAALGWQDTPFHWHQSAKGIGCDCRGLIVGLLSEVGASDWNCLEYTTSPDPVFFLQTVQSVCRKTEVIEPGKLVLLRYPKRHLRHCGLILPGNPLDIIHAYPGLDKVAKHDFTGAWQNRLDSIYELPGVNYADS